MDSDESVQLQVQPPKQQILQLTRIISSWQFKSYVEDYHNLKFYLTINPIYVNKLITKKQQPNLNQQQRRRCPTGTIIIQQFNQNWNQPNGTIDIPTQFKGQIMFILYQYKGIQLRVQIHDIQLKKNDTISAKFLLQKGINQQPRPKVINLNQEGQAYKCLIPQNQYDTYLKGPLAVQIHVQTEWQQETRFRGIRNQGNTCYMNCILQILYYIRPLRDLIIKYEGQGKVIKVLRQIFLGLMQKGFTEPVDAQKLIQAYGHFAEYPRRQQDTEQFMIGFLDQLEGQCPNLHQLWRGDQQNIIQSVVQDKPYKNILQEHFNGLHAPLSDNNGNTFLYLNQILENLVAHQNLQQQIQTDQHGKVKAKQLRQFTVLPPILFITLKRYKYTKSGSRAIKLLSKLQYPSQINLSFLQNTPCQNLQYSLFAVAVHRGQHYTSGHYYSYINTSTQQNDPLWVKFDDRRVHLSSQSQALSFIGGKKNYIVWSKQHGRFVDKQVSVQDTAYIFVYIKKDRFNLYQKIQTPFPQDWIQKKKKNRIQKKKKEQIETIQVNVAVLNTELEYDLFYQPPQFPVVLNKNDDVTQQIKHLQFQIIGCNVGSVWKVRKNDQKIKQVSQYAELVMTPSRIFAPRGNKIPDYLLIVPNTITIYKSGSYVQKKQNSIGIVMFYMPQNGKKIHLVYKSCLQDLIRQYQTNLNKRAHVTEMKKFLQGWNDYCQITFE